MTMLTRKEKRVAATVRMVMKLVESEMDCWNSLVRPTICRLAWTTLWLGSVIEFSV
jgi:hypothetical protein